MNTHEAILPLKSQAATFGSDVWNNRLLYLEFGVQDETEAIKSYSPVFIIVNEPTQKILDDAGKIIEDQEPGPAKPDSDPIPLDGSSPTTSTISPTSTSASQWRRLAPKEKGKLRHAYHEMIWGHGGWKSVGSCLPLVLILSSIGLVTPVRAR